jgi:hypothetical protein
VVREERRGEVRGRRQDRVGAGACHCRSPLSLSSSSAALCGREEWVKRAAAVLEDWGKPKYVVPFRTGPRLGDWVRPSSVRFGPDATRPSQTEAAAASSHSSPARSPSHVILEPSRTSVRGVHRHGFRFGRCRRRREPGNREEEAAFPARA